MKNPKGSLTGTRKEGWAVDLHALVSVGFVLSSLVSTELSSGEHSLIFGQLVVNGPGALTFLWFPILSVERATPADLQCVNGRRDQYAKSHDPFQTDTATWKRVCGWCEWPCSRPTSSQALMTIIVTLL